MAVEPGFEERRVESPMAASEEFIATQELFRGDSHGVSARPLAAVPDGPIRVSDSARGEVNYRDGADDGDGTRLVESHVPRHADADAADDVVAATW
ncbi:hypothetical protein [Nocardia asiatica]|uniref:hypothetical protein n=1 Tax=Nocardia asiatica TaxID=209252 RepID=UPI002454B177|nr:hypothetical protein [Nocardia asiatica]